MYKKEEINKIVYDEYKNILISNNLHTPNASTKYKQYLKSACENVLDKHINSIFNYDKGFIIALLTSNDSVRDTLFTIAYVKLNQIKAKKILIGKEKPSNCISALKQFEELFNDYFLLEYKDLVKSTKSLLIKEVYKKEELISLFKNRINSQTRAYSLESVGNVNCIYPIRTIRKLLSTNKQLIEKYNCELDKCISAIKLLISSTGEITEFNNIKQLVFGESRDNTVKCILNSKEKCILYGRTKENNNPSPIFANKIKEVTIDHNDAFKNIYIEKYKKMKYIPQLSNWMINKYNNENKMSLSTSKAKKYDTEISKEIIKYQQFTNDEFIKGLLNECISLYKNNMNNLELMEASQNYSKNDN